MIVIEHITYSFIIIKDYYTETAIHPIYTVAF